MERSTGDLDQLRGLLAAKKHLRYVAWEKSHGHFMICFGAGVGEKGGVPSCRDSLVVRMLIVQTLIKIQLTRGQEMM